MHWVIALGVTSAVAASALVWMTAIARLRRRQELISYEKRRPVPWDLFDLFVVAVAYLSFPLLAYFALREAMGISRQDEARDLAIEELVPMQLVLGAASLLTVILGAGWAILRTGATAHDLGLSLARLRGDVRLGVIAFAAVAAPIYGLQGLLVYFFPTQHPLIDLLRDRPDPQLFVVVGLSVAIVAPFCEEMLFRVFLQGWLEKLFAMTAPDAVPISSVRGDDSEVRKCSDDINPYAAPQTVSDETDRQVSKVNVLRAVPIFTSALVFSLLHLGHGPAPVPLFFFALALGYLYQRTHRVWASLTLHFLLNSVSLLMLVVDTALVD